MVGQAVDFVNILFWTTHSILKAVKPFMLPQIPCNVKNLIYVIRCKGCQEEYIGETGDILRHRMPVNRQQIRNANVRMLYENEHIAAFSHNMNTQFKCPFI